MSTEEAQQAAEPMSPSSSSFETYKIFVCENQRLIPLKGWKAPWLPGDRPSWTDMYGSGPMKKEGLEVPIPNGEWVGEWTEEPWKYAIDFNLSKFHSTKTLRDFVRQRRWVRVYRGPKSGEYIPPPDIDKEETECALCEKDFNAFNLRHHCRTCHLPVCGPCSGQSLSTPGYATEQRCCNECATRNGVKITGWYLGKAVQRRMKTLRGNVHSDLRNNTKDVILLNTTTPKCGTISLRLHECRGLSGWAGDMGTPNPHLEFYLTGSYIKTIGKAQTHNPKWGESEATYELPCTDPTSSLYFCAYDVSGIAAVKQPLGRGAIPLTSLKAGSKNEFWIDLLPCGEPEAMGYNAEQPKPFRGCSKVTEQLGMHDPKRPLGLIHVTLSYTPSEAPVMGLVPKAYLTAAVFKTPQPTGDEVFRLKDSAARFNTERGPPTLLKFLWQNGVYAAGAVPVWCILSYALHMYQVPYVVAVFLVANGLLLSKTRIPREVILYEENNPFKKPTLWTKLNNISGALKSAAKMHNPVGRAATMLSKGSSLFSYEDPVVSGIATILLVLIAILSSCVIFVVSLFSVRLYIAAVGAAVLVLPSNLIPHKDRKSTDGEVSPEAKEGVPPAKPISKVVAAVTNFVGRVPDDLELAHRQICSSRVKSGPEDTAAGVKGE
eukprot:TRINITY_DN17634_c0_g1_i1.p1 TRINITY_DN17634_c0_g1~~TRINITY_DN17634_c0_g1_i1.p1  ORF type:complete len:688 (+),score=106.04 TRINITY_DN17634_c0_g1_i1:87-2066(+)